MCRERGGCEAFVSRWGATFCRCEGLASPFFLERQGFCLRDHDRCSLYAQQFGHTRLGLHIIVAIVGVLLAGPLQTLMADVGTIKQGDFSLLSLLGAIILLAVVNLACRGTVRRWIAK